MRIITSNPCLALAAALATLVFSSCASKSEVSFPTFADLGVTDGSISPGQNIRLRAGDTLDVRLGGVPLEELSQVTGTYTVDTQGFVNMPGAGRIEAAGLTQDKFQTAVERKYREMNIYTNPTVTVSVPFLARFVNVGGEVRLPQRIAYTPDLTVLSSITAAGGLTEYASQSRIRLYREGKFDVINLKRIRRFPEQDIPLQPGDTIEVFRSFF